MIRLGRTQGALLTRLCRAGGTWSPAGPFTDLCLTESDTVRLFESLEERGLVTRRTDLGAMSRRSYPGTGRRFFVGWGVTSLGVIVARGLS